MNLRGRGKRRRKERIARSLALSFNYDILTNR
jgi:hypothetical protein